MTIHTPNFSAILSPITKKIMELSAPGRFVKCTLMKDITVYTRTTCAPCRALKMWLKNKGITYNEVNIDEDPEAQKQALALSGYSIVPLTVVTKADDTQQVIAGLNFNALTSLV